MSTVYHNTNFDYPKKNKTQEHNLNFSIPMATLSSVVVFPQNIEGISVSPPVNTERLIRFPLQDGTAAPSLFHWLLFMVAGDR
jgi:hypothetical protein